MDNVSRVLAHAATRLAGAPDASRRVLTLVPARDGRPYVVDDDGALWRTYLFIERARTYDIVETPAQAEAAARAFGQFQALLADLPGARLHDTIPDFHHTRKRFDAFAAAVAADPCNRAQACRTLIDMALAREADADRLLAAWATGDVPERVTHNDTKINNVMIDEATGEALCVVDLDTTMPGLAPIDFGDMVRTATNAAAEDEPDPSRVVSRPEMFEALVRGYLCDGRWLPETRRRSSGWRSRDSCSPSSRRSGSSATTCRATRTTGFTTRATTSQRARAQFALMLSIERQRDAYEAVVRRYARG